MLLPLLFTSLLSLQAPTGTIHGIVRAEGSREPIPGAAVTITGLTRTVHADAHGFFVIAAVPAGRWRVEATALGYSSHALTVVTNAAGVRLDFELALRPVPLPGVVVRTDTEQGERTEFIPSIEPGPASVRMTAQAMKVLPGLAEPDVFRALQTLPSITAISDYSSALYVRGGSADQNLITLDGMQLFNPYHVGGIFSAIPTDAVSAVDVHAGALPARMGDRIASSVNINTREGGKDRIRTSGGVGLISTNLTVDGPLNAGRGSFLFSGRRTYLNAITGIGYSLKLIDFTMPYGFSDAYAKATHAVGELGTLSLSGYWNGEQLWTPDRMREEFDGFGEFNWGSRMLALNYRQALPHSLLLHARVGYTDFRGDFDAYDIRQPGVITCDQLGCDEPPRATDTVPSLIALSRTRDVLGAADLTWYGRTHTLRGGVQLDAYHFEHVLESHDINDTIFLPTFDKHNRMTTVAAHVEDEWHAAARLHLRAGARVLRAGSLGTVVMPRLGARWQATDRLAFTAGAGRYAQAMRTMKDDESVVASARRTQLGATAVLRASRRRGTAQLREGVVRPHRYADAVSPGDQRAQQSQRAARGTDSAIPPSNQILAAAAGAAHVRCRMAFLRTRAPLLALLMVCACVPDPTTVPVGRHLVVHAVLVAGADSARVFVGHSARSEYDPFGGIPSLLEPVTNARVRLVHAHDTITLATSVACRRESFWERNESPTSGGCYSGALPAPVRAHEQYELLVDAGGFPALRGSTSVPAAPAVTQPTSGVELTYVPLPQRIEADSVSAHWKRSSENELIELSFASMTRRCFIFAGRHAWGDGFAEPSIRVLVADTLTVRPSRAVCDSGALDDRHAAALVVTAYDRHYSDYLLRSAAQGIHLAEAAVGITGGLGVFGSAASTVVPLTLVRK